MPIGDWQFWIVSALGLAALYFVVRPFIPRRRTSGRSRRVELTIERRKR